MDCAEPFENSIRDSSMSDANIVSHEVIRVLMKEVAEFSAVGEGSVRNEYDNMSVFNFCKEEILKKG